MSYDAMGQLVKMLNQIAENNPCAGDADKAAEVVAGHVQKFWAKSMKINIIAYVHEGGDGLNSVAERAVRQLEKG